MKSFVFLFVSVAVHAQITMEVVLQKPAEGKDPTYNFWEGWLDKTGKLTQKTGVVIDWKKHEEWQSRLKPE